MHSRVHPLRSFPPQCFVKRDDELGFGISGSKVRKYASLIPFLLEHSFEQVIVIGSSHSNHVLSIVQLLIENGIKPILFLKGDPASKPVKGNLLFTSLFVPPSEIHWIPSSEWKDVEDKAYQYITEQKTFVLPEGACIPEALPGALTLPQDIIRNEKEMKTTFQHLFIEAGTGLMAIAVILWYQWINKNTLVHVLLLADDELAFLQRLKSFHSLFSFRMNVSIPFPKHFKLYQPKQATSFGSTNAAIFKEIRFLAQTEGFLTDPIYSAKLFLEARRIIEEEALQGNILLLHSGGGLTLAGFQDELKREL